MSFPRALLVVALGAVLAGSTAAQACVSGPDVDMVTLPGGTFTMGDTISAFPQAPLAPHRVTVSSFEISRTEITQGQWAAVMGFFWGGGEDNLAAGNMTFYDAVAFCNAKSEQEGLQPAYIIDGDGVHWDRAANGYRLPTEA